MTRYLIRRLLQSVIVIFGVTLVTFLSLHLAGDPTYLYISNRATDDEITEIRARLGFDKPLPVQYFNFMGRMVQGDFGNSLRTKTPALQIVFDRLPATIELTLFAMFLAITLAIPIGIISALRRGTSVDGGVMLFAIFGQSMPSFWLGIMLILVVGLQLRWLPISGHIPVLKPLLNGDAQLAFENLPNAIQHLIMPGITIAVFSLSRNARLVRSAMLEVLNQDYVRTARAKGLAESSVVIRHAFRNALIPVVTILGLEFGFLLSGVVVVETVFSWPGVGRLVFNSINQRDIPVVQAAVVMFSFLFVGLNLIVDILYAQLNPKVRLE
ncbi:MAG: ABC transporter permease [Phototrophicaceae bacterium]